MSSGFMRLMGAVLFALWISSGAACGNDSSTASKPPPDAPPGYTVLASNDSGMALSVQKPKATDVQGALESIFPDLAKYFGERPKIAGAFEDTRDHKSGGASFSANLKGQPIKGYVSCTVSQEGAGAKVVWCRSDAPRSELAKLSESKDQAPANAQAPQIALKQYDFPDGTGSIGLAEGWKTNSPTCIQTVILQGPADQQVSIGFMLSVVTPDSFIVQNQRQMEMQAQQLGLPPPPPLQLMVAPLTGPADALKNLVPQLSNLSQRNNGPALRLDKIIDEKSATANIPGGKAALLSYEVTRITDGTEKKFRAVAQVETGSMVPGAWLFYSIELAAPDDTFQKDLPVMMAMVKSLKTNDRVVQERTRQNIDAQNQRFAALQDAHRQQVEAFDSYNKAWERRSNEQSRSFADFDEVIIGYRTVEDTRTGEHTSVDLGNVHEIVEKLNERDPDRYKEIPLRDEMYPQR